MGFASLRSTVLLYSREISNTHGLIQEEEDSEEDSGAKEEEQPKIDASKKRKAPEPAKAAAEYAVFLRILFLSMLSY